MLYGSHVRKLEDIDWLESNGLDFGEVVLKDIESREYWKSNSCFCARRKAFFLIAHGPHEGNPNSLENLHGNYMPSLRDTVLTVSRIGIHFLTTHLWMDSRHVLPEIIEAKIKALCELSRFGKNEGVTISLENLSESSSDFRTVLSEIPDLAITLDIGHGQLLTRINRSFEIIRDFGQSVKHVHVHDNVGGQGVKDDLHLPIGEGTIDFEAIFQALVKSGYDGTMTLELKPEELLSSLALTKEMVSRITGEIGLGQR